MKKLILIVSGLFWSTMLLAQDDPLVLMALVGDQLLLVDSTTAQSQDYLTISGLPANVSLRKLTYDFERGVFYTLGNPTTAPVLYEIADDGSARLIGTLALPGSQVFFAEGLTFDNRSGKLFAALSLDGSLANNDFYSEALVEVDTATAVCTFLSNLQSDRPFPDVDGMDAGPRGLSLYDGQPGGTYSYYALDIEQINQNNRKARLFSATYIPVGGMATSARSIFGGSDNSLFRYDFDSNSQQRLGTTHNPANYDGNTILGLSFAPCRRPDLSALQDTSSCTGTTIALNGSTNATTYLWSTGSAAPVLQVNRSGTYELAATNACGTVSKRVEVIIADAEQVDLGPDTTICEGELLLLDATIPGAQAYLWQNGGVSPAINVSNPGTYRVTVQSACGLQQDSVSVGRSSMLTVNLGPDRYLCPETSLSLSTELPPGSTWQWSDGSQESDLPVTQPGRYWLSASNRCGTASDTLLVLDGNALLSPPINVFTPNGDEYNERFVLDEIYSGRSLAVFNRWGKAIYRTESYANDWDGAEAPAGVYYYKVEGPCRTVKGWLHILR